MPQRFPLLNMHCHNHRPQSVGLRKTAWCHFGGQHCLFTESLGCSTYCYQTTVQSFMARLAYPLDTSFHFSSESGVCTGPLLSASNPYRRSRSVLPQTQKTAQGLLKSLYRGNLLAISTFCCRPHPKFLNTPPPNQATSAGLAEHRPYFFEHT
jgi:hypothetical protein